MAQLLGPGFWRYLTCPRCCPRKHLTCVARDGLASVGLVPVNAWGWVPGNRCRLLRIGIRHRADCREPVSISDDRACALMHPEANYQCRPPTNGTATGSEQRILSRKSDVAVACRYRVQCSGKQPSTSHQSRWSANKEGSFATRVSCPGPSLLHSP